jgi:hypothetical protein
MLRLPGIDEEVDDGDDDALAVGAVDEEDGGLWHGHRRWREWGG